jgi:CheY-like chemotaxis protein
MSKSILSVNGNRAMHYLFQTIFREEYQLIPVSDVFRGMHQFRTNKNIELLIIDVDFETEQSWEMIHHIKTSKLYDVPVVILTSTNNDTIKNRCYELGIDEVFFKPFNPVDVVSAVKSLQSSVYNLS